MKVNIIGSGNVATVLAKLIISKGHHINNIYSRNPQQASVLADEVNAVAISSLHKITNADITIISVSDTAIPDIIKQLPSVQKIIVHTAGAVSINVFNNRSEAYGILYPLQSIRKEMSYLPEMPFLIDGNNTETIELIKAFAETLSKQIAVIKDEERKKLHLAAVLSSNFTNYLYSITQQFCEDEKLDFTLLLPLITETANRLQFAKAKNLQTGPAIRGDNKTMETHLKLLENHLDIKKIYRLLSDAIMELHGKK